MTAARSTAAVVADAWWTKRRGRAAIDRRQRSRFRDMVAFARAESPFYRELYRGLPNDADDPAMLPVSDKRMLMARFDDWCTERALSFNGVETVIADPARVGERILGRYTAVTTSGTTGRRGVFLIDPPTRMVVNAMAGRMLASWLAPSDVVKLARARCRMAMVMASEGHFASSVAAAQLKRQRGERVEVLSARMPLPEIVSRLNRFQPAFLAPYASMAALLADEQAAGRLRIAPVLLALSAEGLAVAEYRRIAGIFGAKVGNSYAASECPFLSYSCDHDWLHVNADWVLVEPVDADHRPVPPGTPSHTVLISNLVNRVQPILRYDLGDGVLERPDPCPCGTPLPAIRVQGRAADVLTFRRSDGTSVRIAPLALSAALDGVDGVTLAQVVQAAPHRLALRLKLAPGADADRAWGDATSGLAVLLAEHGLETVAVDRDERPPEQSPGGKFREVIHLPEKRREGEE